MSESAISSVWSAVAAAGRHIPRLLVLLLGATAAFGAPSPLPDCHPRIDLQSLLLPMGDLSAGVVGHNTAASELKKNDEVSALPMRDDTTVLMLYLAPRMAIILREVFSAVAIETPAPGSPPRYQRFGAGPLPVENLPPSPIASEAAQSDTPQLTDPVPAVEDAESAERIHRQMFRTDI